MGYSGLGYQMQYMNLQQRELLRIRTGFPFKHFPEEKHTNELPKDKRRPRLFWDAGPTFFRKQDQPRPLLLPEAPQGPVRTEGHTELNEREPLTPRPPTKTDRCGRLPAYRSGRARRLRHHSQPTTPATTTAHTAWLSRATRLISAGASGRGLSPMKGLGTSWPW